MRDKSKDRYRLPYSKTIRYYIKTALILFFLILLPACTSSTAVQPDLSSLESANDVVTAGSNVIASGTDKIDEVVTASRDIVNNNSLEWWQWVIVGMFIPTPWSIFIDMCKGIASGFSILFGGFFRK